MEKKILDFELKELKDDGYFEGYASVFGIIDEGNDIVDKGAFKKTLREQKQFSLCWYHDPRVVEGIVMPEEDDRGLFVKGQLNLDVQSARERRSLLKQKAIRGLSIGYKAIKPIFEEIDGKTVRRLKEIKLYEVSLCTLPMNTEALITSVKAMEMKPYPNEHSARLRDPDDFDDDTIRRKGDGTIYGKIKVPETINVIWGKLKEHNKPDDNPIFQALRFPKKDWTVAEAKKWLKDNSVKYISFEPAGKSLFAALETILEGKDEKIALREDHELKEKIQASIEALTALLQASEPPEDGTQKANEKPRSELGKPGDHLLASIVVELEGSTIH